MNLAVISSISLCMEYKGMFNIGISIDLINDLSELTILHIYRTRTPTASACYYTHNDVKEARSGIVTLQNI